MNRKYRMIGLMLAFCFMIQGCGNDAVKDDQVLSAQQENIEEQDTYGQKNNQAEIDKYEELAKENHLLEEERTILSEKCFYYETQLIGKSAEGFDKQDLMDELLQSRQTDVAQNESAGEMLEQNDFEVVSGDDFSIPEIDDTNLKGRIAELEDENNELQMQIDELKKQLDAYKKQYMAN